MANKKIKKRVLLYTQVKNLLDCIQVNYPRDPEQKKYSQDEIARRSGIDPTRLSKAKTDSSEVTDEDRKKFIGRIMETYQVKQDGEEFIFRELHEWTSIKQLAQKLAVNLVDVSTEFPDGDKPHKEIIEDWDTLPQVDDRKRERFIAVVGAGASHAATGKHMPRARKAAERIRNSIKNQEINKLIDKELHRLRQIYRLDKEDFETELLACSKYCRDEVLEELTKICGVRYTPAIIYEILAHMLKHRFIDVIINFNYDEILDNAIEEEVSRGEYFYIYSDGHCPNNYEDLLIYNRLKQPIYIKPHGTISHRSSLRFTREDYLAIPQQIQDHIYDLFKAEIPDSQAQKYLPVNLILIGFSMQSFEFAELVKRYLEEFKDREITFWIFDKKVKLEDFKLELSERQRDRIGENVHFFDLNRFSLEDFLKELWNSIETKFQAPYRPRGIERHLLVDLILRKDQKVLVVDPDNKKALKQYFSNRCYVELAISLLQSDGLLNANQIVEDRAGKYFYLYEEANSSQKQDKPVLGELFKKIGMEVYKGFVWDTFILKKPELFNNSGELCWFLFDNLERTLGKKYLNSKEEAQFKQFSALAEKVRGRNRMKITPEYRHPHKYLFSNLDKKQILNTGLSWVYKYQDSLKNKNASWDLLLTISEKGRFLNREIREGFFQNKNKRLEVILASFDLPNHQEISAANLQEKLNLLSDKPLFLPWWLHNQHMVILLKREGDQRGDWRKNWTLLKGFYYESRMLSRRINPVIIEEEKNLEKMLYIFANYWYRAKYYTECPPNKKVIPIISTSEEMDKHVANLLSLWDE